ncbi:hypothetical protein [Paractinoplanes hotanensis]|uniref:Uncharacterized protein n=1 Tax=Paractinoplanes hotanensis TaxID=2906497 RepID=A0ABT0YH88_9ACTN|nr:hypothetical protein [Actinoplanes hotanensis]MCM4085125.1 hypothetical protein [Actinoplanes hotanensis]
MPLDVRLRGHLNKSTNTFVQAWIAELKAAGLQPIICPLRRNVPAAELAALETAEIHRRAMRREPIFNIAGTERAARHHAEQAAEKARLRELTGWRRTAAHLLKVTGGPIPPGFSTPSIMSDETWATIEQGHALDRRVEAARIEEAAGHRPVASDDTAGLSADLALVAYDIGERADRMIFEDAWRSIRSRHGAPVWRDAVDARVKTATDVRRGFNDRDEADRHLSLLRWYLTVIPPWQSLAYRCAVPPTGPDFHAWVTPDPEVREALRIVEKGEPFTDRAVSAIHHECRRYQHIDLLDVLRAVAAIYSRRDPDPDLVRPVLRYFASNGYLDARMAKIYTTVAPHALDAVYGPDHATRIDADLALPAGTSGQVIRRLDELLDEAALRQLVKRIDATLPTAVLPDITDDENPAAPGVRAIVATLIRAGRVPGLSADKSAYVNQVRASWTPFAAIERNHP